jgi:hypothetical protein
MKLTEIKELTDEVLTEEFSPEFAETLLNEQATGEAHKVEADDLIAELQRNLDRMRNGQKQ